LGVQVHLRIDKRSGELFGVVGRTTFGQLISEVFGMIRSKGSSGELKAPGFFHERQLLQKNATAGNSL